MCQAELLQQPVTVGRPATREQRHGLRDPEPVGQAGALQLAADLLPQPIGVPHWIQAQHPDLTRILATQPLENLDRGGLAGTIRTDQTEDLPVIHDEIEVVDHDPAVVRLGQSADGDDRINHAGEVCPVHAPSQPRPAPEHIDPEYDLGSTRGHSPGLGLRGPSRAIALHGTTATTTGTSAPGVEAWTPHNGR